MQRKHWFILGALIAIVQIAIPLWMIWDKEQTIKKGKTFLFEIAPVDPTHPLKGKYIILDYLPLKLKTKHPLNMDKKVYATLSRNEDDIFQIIHLSNQEPNNTDDYIEVFLYQWSLPLSARQEDNIYNVSFPFSEYYMEEYKAPVAESMYRDLAQDSTFKAYAVIKVYQGNAVVIDVIMNGKSIQELLL